MCPVIKGLIRIFTRTTEFVHTPDFVRSDFVNLQKIALFKGGLSSMGNYVKKGYKARNSACAVCGAEFIGTYNQKYCSQECKARDYHVESQFKGLSTGTVEAIQKLRVSVDLLQKGFEVFKPLSPSGSCDLLALRNGKWFKFEIRTGYVAPNNRKVTYSNRNIKGEYLAITLPDKILYEPEIEDWKLSNRADD